MASCSKFDSNKICCPYHPSAVLIEDDHAGDMICPECGLVVGDRVIDVSAEWRTFSNSDSNEADRNRCGGPENLLLSGSNLTTIIGSGTGAASFDEFGAPKYSNRQTPKDQKHKAVRNTKHTLITAFNEISSMANRIELPNPIIYRANCLVKQLLDKKLLKGPMNKAKATACLYIACRQEGAPRTCNEICAVSNVSKKDMWRCYKMCLKVLETKFTPITVNDFVPRFCANLELPFKIQNAATHIAKKAMEMGIDGARSPLSIAAAAIYLASQVSEQKRSEQEISEIADVAPCTIRVSYRQLYPHARSLFPENFIFSTPIESLPLI